MSNLLIDFESRSRADLTKTGQHIYARHPSTEILCLGWKMIGEEKAHVLTLPQIYLGEGCEEFLYAVKHSKFKVAHNAAFEQAMWTYCLLPTTKLGSQLPELSPKDWVCTLSFCSILSLPRSLENAGEALGLSHKKDASARKLLLSMCKPRRPINDIGKWIEWIETDDALKGLYKYCEKDLWAEEELFNRLAPLKPFTEKERKLWILDQKINQRGITIDIPLVNRTMELIKQEETELTHALHKNTFGWVKSTRQTKVFKAFLADQGFEIPDLKAKTIDAALFEIQTQKRVANEEVIEVLKIRQSLGKSSTSKYAAFLNRADFLDNKLRDNYLFHGAGTGRWSGKGLQTQNLPRGNIKGFGEPCLVDIRECDLETLRILYKRPMDLFSHAIRSMITPDPGYEMFCGDFSSIEARVLLWCAGDTRGMKEYEQGLDTYITMGMKIYNKTYEEIHDEYVKEGFAIERHVGKEVVLGCGFQMGLAKFKATLADKGIYLADEVIERAHRTFREKYPLVPKLWKNYENAAVYAVQNPGKMITVNKVQFYTHKGYLFAKLPSGRRLSYPQAYIEMAETSWGKLVPKLHFKGAHPKTGKWGIESTYGGKIVENIVQAISRDCMAESMTRCEIAGYQVLMSIHDEIPSQRKIGEGSLEDYKKLMSTCPEWGLDIPLRVGAWGGNRYRK